MDGFQAMGVLILLALSVVVISTRGTSTRQRQPAPPPPRTLRRPHKARQRAYYQRRIRHMQREQQMLVTLVLFALRHTPPPAPDV